MIPLKIGTSTEPRYPFRTATYAGTRGPVVRFKIFANGRRTTGTRPTMTDDFMAGAEVMSPEALELKRELVDIITRAERSRPRSKQVELGPSDLGSVCDRRIGYKIAEIPEVNGFLDPWTVFVGSAIHTRLQECIDNLEDVDQKGRYVTEMSAPLDPLIPAHIDLYDTRRKWVIDHKSTTSDSIKKLKAGEDINPGYIIQVQLYGLALTNLGHPVEKVALAFYPRAGRLRDLFVHVEDFDPDIARVAWQRPYDIATLLTDLNVLDNPAAWQQVPAVASTACGLCPWYDPNRLSPADDSGCPGNES